MNRIATSISKSVTRSASLALVLLAAVVLAGCSSAPAAAPTVAAGACKNGDGTVVKTPTGLQYEDLIICEGRQAKDGDTVSVHYQGTLQNGTEFDSSFKRNQPFDFKLGAGGVIAGWDQGVKGMTIGSKRRLVIPPELGYGAQANGPIPANATLNFVIQVMDIK